MLLPELHDELIAAAARAPLRRRASAWAVAAFCAALLALLIAVPTTQARLPMAGALIVQAPSP